VLLRAISHVCNRGEGAATTFATRASSLRFPATILKRQIIALSAGKAAIAILRDHKHDFEWKRVMTAGVRRHVGLSAFAQSVLPCPLRLYQRPKLFTEGSEGNKDRLLLGQKTLRYLRFLLLDSPHLRERILTEDSEGNKGCFFS